MHNSAVLLRSASAATILEASSAARNGPEAGVWVIAETTDTPTRYAKIVVTDERGRYLIPDLPKGNYQVWVRGYGLVDSAKVQASPGKTFDLTAVPAPDAGCGGAILSADLLVFVVARAREKRIPDGAYQEPGRVAEHREERCLPILSRPWHSWHPDHQQAAWYVQGLGGRLGGTAAGRQRIGVYGA